MANATHTTLELTPRHLWLALLGSTGMARRQLASGMCAARMQVGLIGNTLRAGGGDARDIARGIWLTMQERLADKPRRRASKRSR